MSGKLKKAAPTPSKESTGSVTTPETTTPAIVETTPETPAPSKENLTDAIPVDWKVTATRVSQDEYEVNFNASALSSGVYFYRIQSPSFTETKKMILIK